MEPLTKKALMALDEVGFRELMHSLNLAKSIRCIISDYDIKREDIADLFGIEKNEVGSWVNGSFDYTLRDISNVQEIEFRLAEEKRHAEQSNS